LFREIEGYQVYQEESLDIAWLLVSQSCCSDHVGW
jgi:hypothetical protein